MCASEKLQPVYSKAITPDSKDVRDKEPCQHYLDCTYRLQTQALCLTHTPSCIRWTGWSLEPQLDLKRSHRPFPLKWEEVGCCTLSSPVLGVMSRDGEKDTATTIRGGRVWGTKQTQHPGLNRKRVSRILGSLRQENQYESGSAKTQYF